VALSSLSSRVPRRAIHAAVKTFFEVVDDVLRTHSSEVGLLHARMSVMVDEMVDEMMDEMVDEMVDETKTPRLGSPLNYLCRERTERTKMEISSMVLCRKG